MHTTGTAESAERLEALEAENRELRTMLRMFVGMAASVPDRCLVGADEKPASLVA